jgi:hypothetical protein
MVRTSNMHGRDEELRRNHLGDIYIDGKLILNWVLE